MSGKDKIIVVQAVVIVGLLLYLFLGRSEPTPPVVPTQPPPEGVSEAPSTIWHAARREGRLAGRVHVDGSRDGEV